ncbi:MAG: DUF3050 domain-containing protein [Planctomycetaceae bacterium]|nr:DUF3050 domain-containing protein [Planctomycetaceae bacterium]
MSVSEIALSPAETVLQQTADLRAELLAHPIYESVRSIDQLGTFMSHHVFAVCDFMWLLKRLQREICGTANPWTPPANPQLARFINEIVLGEESDEDGQGGYRSHFELYRAAMDDVGAETSRIDEFLTLLNNASSVPAALCQLDVPASVRRFTTTNYDLATTGSAAQVAAAFCFGREDIIPDMFERLLAGFQSSGVATPALQHYIERHIELDGDHHGPLALEMVNLLCGDSPQMLHDVVAAARSAIANRIELWDGVLSAMS